MSSCQPASANRKTAKRFRCYDCNSRWYASIPCNVWASSKYWNKKSLAQHLDSFILFSDFFNWFWRFLLSLCAGGQWYFKLKLDSFRWQALVHCVAETRWKKFLDQMSEFQGQEQWVVWVISYLLHSKEIFMKITSRHFQAPLIDNRSSLNRKTWLTESCWRRILRSLRSVRSKGVLCKLLNHTTVQVTADLYASYWGRQCLECEWSSQIWQILILPSRVLDCKK